MLAYMQPVEIGLFLLLFICLWALGICALIFYTKEEERRYTGFNRARENRRNSIYENFGKPVERNELAPIKTNTDNNRQAISDKLFEKWKWGKVDAAEKV